MTQKKLTEKICLILSINFDMRILVTGATGFIGKTLIPYLIKSGYTEIAITVRNIEKANLLFPNQRMNIIHVDEDLSDKIIKYNPDIVINLATYFSGRSDESTIHKLIESNITFPTLLLEALRRTSCKAFVNIGTFTEFVYGAGEKKCNNLYSATKSALRPIVKFYQQESGWKWFNIIIYSPYGRKNISSKKVIDYLVEALDSSDPIPFSGGDQKLDFIHVDDVADFFVRLIERIDDISESFTELHLGSGECHSIKDVAFIMEKTFEKKMNADWGKLSYRENEAMHTVAPIAKMIKLLKWTPKITLEEGIRILKADLNTSDVDQSVKNIN